MRGSRCPSDGARLLSPRSPATKSARPPAPPALPRSLPEPHTYRPQGRRRTEGVGGSSNHERKATTLTAPGRARARKAPPHLSTPARLRGAEPERGRGRDRRSGLTAASANGKIAFAFLLLPARGVITARPLRVRVFP